VLKAYGDNKGGQDRGARRRREKSQIAVTVEFSRLAALRQLGKVCRHPPRLVAGQQPAAERRCRLFSEMERKISRR